MKRIFIDMDGVICDYMTPYNECIKNDTSQKYPQSVKGFFENLVPIDDAIDSINELRKHYDVWILSAPSYMNPYSYIEKRIWIEKYFGLEFVERLILSCNKGFYKGDYLIDDTDTKGQLEFEGEFIRFGSGEFKNWKQILKYLKKDEL